MEEQILYLQEKAKQIRLSVIRSIHAAGSGHTGGSLGMADLFAALYFSELQHDPKNPKSEHRDRLILSIGHIAPVLYASLAEAGYFPKEELLSLRKMGSRLQGHPSRNHGLPGIESSSGSLGQGLGIAVGMALAAQLKGEKHRIFCISGDGELQEGSNWEAAMSAAHHQLTQLVWIIDRNRLQIDGRTSDVMEIEPLADKLRAFGWETHEVDGNNMEEILQLFSQLKKSKQGPTAIIAKTKMGKGIPEIENNHHWHGKAPSDQEYERFVKILTEK